MTLNNRHRISILNKKNFILKKTERKTHSPSKIRDDTSSNTHGHRSSSSENEDEAEKKGRIENDIQSHFKALKEAIKKLTRKEITRRNDSQHVNSKSEESFNI
jgi:hypothetical protein